MWAALSHWTLARVGSMWWNGIMILRPMHVLSFGMEAVRAMQTTLRLKPTARSPALTQNTLCLEERVCKANKLPSTSLWIRMDWRSKSLVWPKLTSAAGPWTDTSEVMERSTHLILHSHCSHLTHTVQSVWSFWTISRTVRICCSKFHTELQ